MATQLIPSLDRRKPESKYFGPRDQIFWGQTVDCSSVRGMAVTKDGRSRGNSQDMMVGLIGQFSERRGMDKSGI